MAKAKGKEALPIEEKVEAVEEVKEQPKGEDFLARKLKAINMMEKPAKAQRLANRLLRKARKK